MLFTPNELKTTETETQGWIQFETAEYILEESIRDAVLDVMRRQGANKACGFIGPFDAVMRCGVSPGMDAGKHHHPVSVSNVHYSNNPERRSQQTLKNSPQVGMYTDGMHVR